MRTRDGPRRIPRDRRRLLRGGVRVILGRGSLAMGETRDIPIVNRVGPLRARRSLRFVENASLKTTLARGGAERADRRAEEPAPHPVGVGR